MPAGNQNSLIKKASAQNMAKALKFMRFLGLVASRGGQFHLLQNTVRNNHRNPHTPLPFPYTE